MVRCDPVLIGTYPDDDRDDFRALLVSRESGPWGSMGLEIERRDRNGGKGDVPEGCTIIPILPGARRMPLCSRCHRTAGAYSGGRLRVNHVMHECWYFYSGRVQALVPSATRNSARPPSKNPASLLPAIALSVFCRSLCLSRYLVRFCCWRVGSILLRPALGFDPSGPDERGAAYHSLGRTG